MELGMTIWQLSWKGRSAVVASLIQMKLVPEHHGRGQPSWTWVSGGVILTAHFGCIHFALDAHATIGFQHISSNEDKHNHPIAFLHVSNWNGLCCSHLSMPGILPTQQEGTADCARQAGTADKVCA